MNSQEQASKSIQITLIDGESSSIKALYEALNAYGYPTRLFNDSNEALMYLSRTDILMMDLSVASQPNSSKLIKIPTILVLAANGIDKLPPWLEARHVRLLSYPEDPLQLINHLPEYMDSPSDANLEPANSEHLALLFSINQSLSGHLDINELFERTLALAPMLSAHFATLLVMEEDETIYYRSSQPGREELTGPAGRRFAKRLLKDGLEGWVLRHNQPAVLPNITKDSRWFRASYLPEEEHSVVALPIALERVEAKGVFVIGHEQPEHFTKNDLPPLEAAVIQIGMAIENAILFKNQSERSVQLSLINEVGQAATSILNLDVMLRTVVEAIRRSFAFYSVSIHLYNPDTQLVELRAKAPSSHVEFSRQESAVTHKLRQGLTGWSLATNRTILANDVTQDRRYILNVDNKEVRAELCVPISLGIKTIGVLDLQSTQLEAFDKYHVSAMETLADQLAIAIENAQLYDAINHHVQELTSLNAIGQAITSTLNLQETLTLITDHTTRLMDVAAASVALRDDEANEVWFAAASGEGSEAVIGLRMGLEQGLAGWVAAIGEPVIVADVYADQRFCAEVDRHSGFITQSILCVPLKTKGQTIGAIEVMNKQNGTFNKEDQSLLQALAVSAATAIENAQLYEEKIRTIERLAETQSQLVQSAKLAAVGELAAGVAHEINNPLTTIMGCTSLLLDNSVPATDEERREDLHTIYEEARRARDIVRSLLNFARADIPQRNPTDLNNLIEEAIFLVYTKSVSQKIELKKSLEPLPEMLLDVNQIKQVMVNLLNNAVQAMLNNQGQPAVLSINTRLISQPLTDTRTSRITKEVEGKTVSVVSTDRANVRSHNGTTDSKTTVLCEISDTGYGIEADHLDRVFDPFFTTKEVGQGTGLGLSISYSIVEKHGGSIGVESVPGKGTTFTITLPVNGPDC